jgi:multimeric flavodoxin WrbA
MQVILEYDDQSISIKHDETEKVFELNYTNGNSCKIPDDKVKEICKIGQSDACIFCSVSGGGFECQKFDSFMSRMLLDRHSKGTMNASRIGNCKIVGRIDD